MLLSFFSGHCLILGSIFFLRRHFFFWREESRKENPIHSHLIGIRLKVVSLFVNNEHLRKIMNNFVIMDEGDNGRGFARSITFSFFLVIRKNKMNYRKGQNFGILYGFWPSCAEIKYISSFVFFFVWALYPFAFFSLCASIKAYFSDDSHDSPSLWLFSFNSLFDRREIAQ